MACFTVLCCDAANSSNAQLGGQGNITLTTIKQRQAVEEKFCPHLTENMGERPMVL